MKQNAAYRVGLIGYGSWATAIAKVLVDNHFTLHWWFRKAEDIHYLQQHHHHPRYLPAIHFPTKQLKFTTNLHEIMVENDWIVIAVPSAFVESLLQQIPASLWENKSVVSGIKGILPDAHQLLNDYLATHFAFPIHQYFAITGPCHAEEVASEKLSYITISGLDIDRAQRMANRFRTDYLKTMVNDDLWGAQYAAVLKNIYAIGAGIAHGLGHGDNFLAVYVSNCAHEMDAFNQALCAQQQYAYHARNAFASAYLGDLLVTCYSQYSRNRTLGTMIGKGYPVKSALLELGMVAEGYYASQSVYTLNQQYRFHIPIAETIYRVLWEHLAPEQAILQLAQLFR
ncbi:MAG: NAD(P)H-dependent glycerol-3-phosphate dehydrogenase [Thermoflavifilum sp.]|nr:NAD(P)H-dependent glycerol-3-phosphate dehydrogenase [Thermoflavifilum sp.]